MNRSPNPVPNPNSVSNNRRLWLLILRRGGIALGGFLLVGIAGGGWWLWNFIHNDLAPLAEQNLTTALKRPVKLGKLKEFTLTGVRFGASSVPPTPTDPERLTVDTIDVGFDPLQILFNHTLKLNVTLVNPDIYLQQDGQGRWITTTFPKSTSKEAIKTDLDKIYIRDGKLTLLANSNTQNSQNLSTVNLTQINGEAQLLENNQLIKFDLEAEPTTGGHAHIVGETRPQIQKYNVRLQGQGILVSLVSHLVKLPLRLKAGRANADLVIDWQQKQQPLLEGNVDVQSVVARIPKAPQPFLNAQGKLYFHGLKIDLDNVVTSYGKIPLVANGVIDRINGFNLVARVNSVSVPTALETLKVKLPLAATGVVKADVKVTGGITKPIISGTVVSIKPGKIDKVDLNSFSSQFEFSPVDSVVSLRDIHGQTKVGGEINGGGTIYVGKTPQLDIVFAAKNVNADALAQVYDTTLPPKFQIGTVSATAKLSGSPSNLQTTVELQAPNATYPGTGEVIVAADRSVLFRNVALVVAGGTVRAFGSWANQHFSAVADAAGVQIERFVNPSQLQNVSLAGAQFNGRLLVSGTSSPFKISKITGENAGVNLAGGRINVSNIQLADQSFAAQLVAEGVQVRRLLKQPPQALQGALAGNFQISGPTNNLSLKTLQGTGSARLAVANGIVNAEQIKLADGVYKTQLVARGIELQQLAQLPPRFQGKLNGEFNVAGSVNSFKPEAIQATGQARVNLASGIVTASNIQVANGRYQANVQTTNLPLQQLAQVPPQFQGNLTGQLNVAGPINSFKPAAIQATGQARVNIAGGTVTASNIQLADGRYQAVVDTSGIALNRFNQQLRGDLSGRLQVAGSVEAVSLANLRALGKVRLSQGITLIQNPVTATIGWDGGKLIVHATATDLNADGYITANANAAGIPSITGLNLNVQAKNLNLQNLPLKLPSVVALAGKADFNGRITGNLPIPNLQGQLALRDLLVNKLAFEPALDGNIQLVKGQGLELNLTGKRDRIALNLDANNHPNSFLVQWQQAVASGQSQGDNLAVKVDNFPLTALNIKVPGNTILAPGAIAGIFTGNFQVNQKTFAVAGDAAIAKPQLGRIIGDRLVAQFRYGDGKATLINSEFDKGKSVYAFTGSGQLSKPPQLQGKLTVSQGQIQDILTALQFFDIQDFRRGLSQPTYGNATDIANTNSVGLPQKPLFDQLQFYSQIQALLAQQQQQKTSPIPELADLSGTFNADVDVNTGEENGLAVNFKLNGQNFAWGRINEPNRYYHVNNIIAEGEFKHGVLRLQPLRLESKDRIIAFTGNLGSAEQSGQLQVNNFPIQVLSNFVKLPVGFTGNLDATASIAGTILNPEARGELDIANGTINQKSVQSATASFNYDNGRLNFGSNLNVSGKEPVTIIGSIPYRLPFALIEADNNQISLSIKAKNEGLSVLSLLTNQVAFENGQGEVDIAATGTLQNPTINGIASVNGATFSSQALPENLTDVTGNVQFNFDQILVNNIRGKFSRGMVDAAGVIPISDSSLTVNNPLTVNLDRLALKIKGLYQGGASGKVQITGSIQKPVIGGNVQLANGKVSIPDTSASSTSAGNGTNIAPASSTNDKQDKSQNNKANTSFDNLDLHLGDNLHVIRSPLFDFRATGDLTVNGSLASLSPSGTIRLRSGSVNLFTTQLSLTRGYPQTVTFSPDNGLDPDLNIQLFAKVLDALQSPDFSRVNSTGGLSSLETVRVEATVKGPASQINQNLQLTSSPTRGQTEIVSLLGGGFINTGGRGDAELGIINAAGSAVFSNFQSTFNQVATAFGLSELRIFPTVISRYPETGGGNSSIQLAAEAGVDISPRFSASTIKILTTSDPIQWGINYRINPQVRLRASSNFGDDSRAVIEYQTRF